MSQYTAEQVEQLANALPDIYSEQAVALDAYAATLKAAQGGVMEAMVSLIHLWRQREDNGEQETEFDKGYQQASDECAAALEAALPAEPAAQGEVVAKVVAWRYRLANGTYIYGTANTETVIPQPVVEATPLYTASAAQPAERVPEFGAEDWMRTHAHAARKAMLIAVRHGEVLYPVIDDPAFWRHEINALDKAMLAASPAPSAQPDSKVIGSDSQIKPGERVPEGYVVCRIPDEMQPQLCAPISIDWMARQGGHRDGWNACRKAMLETVLATTPAAPAEEGDGKEGVR